MGHHNPRRARAIEIGVGRGPTLGRLDDGRRWSVENKRKEEKEEKREKERRDSSRWRASRRVAREREGRRSDAARVAWDHRLELTTHFFAAKVCALFSRRRRDASLVIASSSSSPLSWYVPLLLIFSFPICHFREKKRITGKVEHKSIFRRCDFFLQRSEKLKRRDGRKRSERRKRTAVVWENERNVVPRKQTTIWRGERRRRILRNAIPRWSTVGSNYRLGSDEKLGGSIETDRRKNGFVPDKGGRVNRRRLFAFRKDSRWTRLNLEQIRWNVNGLKTLFRARSGFGGGNNGGEGGDKVIRFTVINIARNEKSMEK